MDTCKQTQEKPAAVFWLPTTILTCTSHSRRLHTQMGARIKRVNSTLEAGHRVNKLPAAYSPPACKPKSSFHWLPLPAVTVGRVLLEQSPFTRHLLHTHLIFPGCGLDPPAKLSSAAEESENSLTEQHKRGTLCSISYQGS